MWPLLAWSVVAAFAAVAVGRRIRRREDDADDARTRPDPSALPLLPVPVHLGLGDARRRSGETAALDRLIGVLDRQDSRLAKVALLRWIGGLSPARAAAVLQLTPAEVERDLATARAVVRRAASDEHGA